MGLTTSLFACLLLLMPGLTALAVWNLRGTRQTARRPELPLTAVNSLFVTIGLSMIIHVLGVLAVCLFLGAVREWNLTHLPDLPLPHNPYPAAVQLLAGRMSDTDPGDVFALLCLIGLESAVVARLLSTPGVNLAFEGQDLRGVGWANKHFLQPLRHDYTPIGFVMLQATDDGRGIGFSGPIDELRLNGDGEVKSISLGKPQRFVYELRKGSAGGWNAGKSGTVINTAATGPEIEIHDAEWVGGVVHLSADRIENIVIHNGQDEALEEQAAVQKAGPPTKIEFETTAPAPAPAELT